jgi:DNA polymerase-3 subunit delta'
MPWNQLTGHERAVDFLRGSVTSDRLAHAYLFDGPDGVGKMLAARLLAQAVLCPQATGGDACGECSTCRRVTRGQHPDLIFPEMPEKQEGDKVHEWRPLQSDDREIPVSTARHLREQIAYKPLERPRQVTIIPDADRLNTAAENAFLKTLEEPPPHALLILTTCRAQDLLPTTRSRCVRVRFGTLTPQQIQQVLLARGVPDDAAGELAVYGAGSVGNALAATGDVVQNLRGWLEKSLHSLLDPNGPPVADLARTAEDVVLNNAKSLQSERGMTEAAGRRVEALRLLAVTGLYLRETMLLALADGAGMLWQEVPAMSSAAGQVSPQGFETAFEHVAQAERAVRQNVRLGLVLHVLLLRLRRSLSRRQ